MIPAPHDPPHDPVHEAQLELRRLGDAGREVREALAAIARGEAIDVAHAQRLGDDLVALAIRTGQRLRSAARIDRQARSAAR